MSGKGGHKPNASLLKINTRYGPTFGTLSVTAMILLSCYLSNNAGEELHVGLFFSRVLSQVIGDLGWGSLVVAEV